MEQQLERLDLVRLIVTAHVPFVLASPALSEAAVSFTDLADLLDLDATLEDARARVVALIRSLCGSDDLVAVVRDGVRPVPLPFSEDLDDGPDAR